MQKITKSLSVEDGRARRQWYVVDADGVSLGRLATRVASALRGKNNPAFTPHVDCGDFVIVINASKVVLTGAKSGKKLYHRHTGYPGGVRTRTAGEFLAKKPADFIRTAVGGMLPANKLGKHLINKLKVYTGPEHPHTAQRPKPLA